MHYYRKCRKGRAPKAWLPACWLFAWILMITLNIQSSFAQQPVKLNQLGFYPEAEKIAILPDGASGKFEVIEVSTDEVAYTGESSSPQNWFHSGEQVSVADFSALDEPGRYRIEHDEAGNSHEFRIRGDVHRELSKGSIRALYYNRASTELTEEFAGDWARPEGHPDDEVIVHASAATDQRPEGYTFSSPKGWYDAGDFNKYVVNSGISTYTLLAAYEHYPEYYDQLELNIPESENERPDILDETRWNLDWMLTMQDPHDGGVYHKLTAPGFEGQIMPHQANSDRYVVQKSTAAALNFAAVMATASRVFDKYDPDFASEALEASEYAWQWAEDNPDEIYNQSAMNEDYNPDIVTGEYGDSNLDDEFDWAAAELYITTGNDAYWNAREFDQVSSEIPSWQYVRPLAWISLARHIEDLTDAAETGNIEDQVVGFADDLVSAYESEPYQMSMGTRGGQDFVWGSNGIAGNHSVMLLQAYHLTGNETYLNAAQSNLDYILGRNPTGYSFVTGFGSHTPMDPHHRQSTADDNEDPVPGFVVGGPQAGQQDGCDYPSDLPARSYLDDWCSYSTNEVAINWNAPLVYVTGAIDHYLGEEVVSVQPEEQPLEFELKQNYPNPFNPSTQIVFTLPEPSDVTVDVYAADGRKVATLVDEFHQKGEHSIRFEPENLSSGVYLYRLETEHYIESRTMTYIK